MYVVLIPSENERTSDRSLARSAMKGVFCPLTFTFQPECLESAVRIAYICTFQSLRGESDDLYSPEYISEHVYVRV